MVKRELRFGLDDYESDTEQASKSRRPRGTIRFSFSTLRFTNGTGNEVVDETGDETGDEAYSPLKEEGSDLESANQSAIGKKRKRDELVGKVVQRKAKYNVGVDLGMTFFGISSGAEDINPENVTAQQSWPGTSEIRSKGPNVLAYLKDNPGFEDKFGDEESLFAFEVPREMRSHAYFKKSLDDDASESKFDDPILEKPAGKALMKMPKSIAPGTAVINAYKHLYSIVMDKLANQMGEKFLNDANIRFVLTHPANCSEQGRAKTMKAAEDAGFKTRPGDELAMISEAEAALIAACVWHKKNFGTTLWTESFKEKALITVLDIGGLTVDTATYLITRVEPKLKLVEKCIPNGGKCGTVVIYCHITDLLGKMFGEEFTNLPDTSIGHGSPFLSSIEALLRDFTAKDVEKTFRLQLAMSEGFEHESYDEIDGEIILKGSQIQGILDIVVGHILGILNDQIQRASQSTIGSKAKLPGGKVKTLVSCGGGSRYPYIHSELKKSCAARKPKINLIRPDDPQSVVSIGAVIAFLKERIVGLRRSRACYGNKIDRKWDGGDWDEADIFECPRAGKRVDGFVHWHILKDAEIDTAKRMGGPVLKCYTTLTENDLKKKIFFEVPIYTYSGEKPWPKRVNEPGVCKLGSFEVKPYLMSKEKQRNVCKQIKGSEKAKVKMTMRQLVATDLGVIEFEVRIGRTVVGRHQLNYDATRQA